MIRAQGGNPDADLSVAPASDVTSTTAGVVTEINTEQLGLAIIAMGGGRQQVADKIDHSVGLEVLVRIGDTVTENQLLARLFTQKSERHIEIVRDAFTIGDSAQPLPLVVETIE